MTDDVTPFPRVPAVSAENTRGGASSRHDDAAAKKPGWAYVYRLGCGCRAEWSGEWKILRRCKRHPRGVIPVRTMTHV